MKLNPLSQTIFITVTILAPSDVLQYFTGSTGTVSSFNFALQAPSATAVRQLAYQKYKIGYRSEVIGSAVSCFLFSVLIHESRILFLISLPVWLWNLKAANSISFTPCISTTNPSYIGFSLTGDATSSPGVPSTCCTTDFLTLLSQTLSISGGSATLLPCDRLCGAVPYVAGQSYTCKFQVCPISLEWLSIWVTFNFDSDSYCPALPTLLSNWWQRARWHGK